MHLFTRPRSLALLALLAPRVLSQCQSYGTDYVDGGTYCINTQLSDYFSFGTSFSGCQASDSQGNITPILVDPNNNEYFCSDIPITPAGTTFVSTCNVAGNEVRKSSMFSGTWVIVIEGLTFAYMRSLNIVAGPPVVVTTTPTVTFTSTVVPTTTTLTTATATNLSTLPPVTVTSPSTTVTKTYTVIAAPTTTTSTLTITATSIGLAFSVSTRTVTVTTACSTLAPARDRLLNFKPTKTPSAKVKNRVRSGPLEAHREIEARRDLDARAALARRTPDLCTTTVIASSNLPSVTVTTTAATVTVPSIVYTTITSTVTPAAVTVYTGSKVVLVTTTKPGLTFTIPAVAYTTVKITSTLIGAVTQTIKVPPNGAACLKS